MYFVLIRPQSCSDAHLDSAYPNNFTEYWLKMKIPDMN